MYPKVHVLFYDGNTFRFEERDAMNGMNSTNPVDYGLKADCEINLVLFKMQAQGVWLDGKRIS